MTDSAPPRTSETASTGLDPHVGGLIAYLTWIGGLIMLLTQKHREVRFHAAQSILFNIALLAVYIGLTVVEVLATSVFGLLGLLTWALFGLVGLAGFVLWIVLALKGYRLEHVKLPLIGGIAEQWAK